MLAVITYRDDQPAAIGPLRVALGDLGGSSGVARLSIEPLSPAGVRKLAHGRGVDSEQLYQRTAGNPFYVTEVLDADGPSVPPTVCDAVLSRVSRLDAGARDVLDVVASSPTAAEVWLLDEVCGDCDAGVAAGLAAGMLVEVGGAVAFRHEIAREAVEAAIPAHRRRELHRTILTALTSRPVQADPARLAHHAEIAGETGAAVRYARAAAARSASVGAHRQAAAQYGRALRFAGDLAPSHRRESAPATARDRIESLKCEIGELARRIRWRISMSWPLACRVPWACRMARWKDFRRASPTSVTSQQGARVWPETPWTPRTCSVAKPSARHLGEMPLERFENERHTKYPRDRLTLKLGGARGESTGVGPQTYRSPHQGVGCALARNDFG